MSNTDGEYAKLQKGKFYWISIKQYDDGSQHAIRIADKWSVAQWDGHSFEEMNEMYRPEDVVKIGQIIPTQEELASLHEQLKQQEDELKEKDEQVDLLCLKLGFSENTNKKFSDAYNELEKKLKQQEEVIRELIEALVSASECLESEGYQQFPEEINAVIKNAKSLTTKDK